MDASSVQHMEMHSNSLENMLVCSKSQQDSRKPRPQPEEALKCPRCDSTNTKFCYYNNYSLSQPRYFCKSCRRYWTKGGTLRNVPVGGGCRKNKRSSSSSSASSKRSQDYQSPLITPNNNPLTYDTSDLNLAFARLRKQASGQLGFEHDHHHDLSILGNPTTNTTHYDILGNPISHGFLDAQNINNFQNVCYGFGNGGGWGVGAGGEIMGMPYEELMSPATTNAVTVTTMKQEMLCNGRELGENRSLWGFPWQLNGDGNMGDLESSARESWNFDLLQPGMGFSIAH